MTADEMIIALKEGKKVTHRFFLPHEYIYMRNTKGNAIYTEDGYRNTLHAFFALRTATEWQEGWSIFNPKK